jgi:hypothetical protein
MRTLNRPNLHEYGRALARHLATDAVLLWPLRHRPKGLHAALRVLHRPVLDTLHPISGNRRPVRPATVELDGTLTTGTLAGTPLSGLFSYNAAAATGVGTEFLGLLAFDVNLLGVHFTRADIDQGGQVILQNGELQNVTAAFFPPPPSGTPVNDIAFGFGGPGIIGYVEHATFGSGTFTLTPVTPTPEPASALLLLMALVMGGATVLRRARPPKPLPLSGAER